MKHATPSSLQQITELLVALRSFGELKETKTGTFYRGRSAFLHFHEDPAGLFADAKLDGREFTRFSLSELDGKDKLLKAVSNALKPPSKSKLPQCDDPSTAYALK
jgi:hypothetical protein